jgi:hypothetical protein
MLDPKEEKRFEKLRGMCRELKVPAPPEIMIGLQVHEGGVLTFDDVQRGHSWTRNFWNFLWGCAADGKGDGGTTFGAGYMTAKSTAGAVSGGGAASSYHYSLLGGNYGLSGAVAIVTSGIVIGTDDTAFSIDQFALSAQISNATIAHTAMANFTQSYALETWKMTLVRIFNNNSGGSVTVKETGLYVTGNNFAGSSGSLMFERSVLSPTVAVANGAQLTVTYEISMDFSAID